jgi:hypothetical protein
MAVGRGLRIFIFLEKNDVMAHFLCRDFDLLIYLLMCTWNQGILRQRKVTLLPPICEIFGPLESSGVLSHTTPLPNQAPIDSKRIQANSDVFLRS